MSRQGSYNYERLIQMCEVRGLEFRDCNKNYSKRDYVNVFCVCSGERPILVSGLDKSIDCCKRKSKLGQNNPQFGAKRTVVRNWKQEILETCSRLNLSAPIPEKLTAHARIKFTCPHGSVRETGVLRLVERKYCCKSQASKNMKRNPI
jgi:hypothetical protein